MTHLGDRISALVDGQLPLDAIERANAHLAQCCGCREAAEAERAMKALLGGLGAPQTSGVLLSRLVALGGPEGPLPPRPGRVPGTPRPTAVPLGARAPRSAPDAVTAEAALVGAALGDTRTFGATAALPGRVPAPGRGPSDRPAGRSDGRSGVRPAPSRPAGRSRARRVRLAGAVLGALGVVGAGVGGLVLVAQPATPGTSTGPVVLDRLSVVRPTPTSGLLPQTVSLITTPDPTLTPSSSR